MHCVYLNSVAQMLNHFQGGAELGSKWLLTRNLLASDAAATHQYYPRYLQHCLSPSVHGLSMWWQGLHLEAAWPGASTAVWASQSL